MGQHVYCLLRVMYIQRDWFRQIHLPAGFLLSTTCAFTVIIFSITMISLYRNILPLINFLLALIPTVELHTFVLRIKHLLGNSLEMDMECFCNEIPSRSASSQTTDGDKLTKNWTAPYKSILYKPILLSWLFENVEETNKTNYYWLSCQHCMARPHSAAG